MKIMEKLILFEYFVITVCDFRVPLGQLSSKPITIWGNQNDHDDIPEQRMVNRSKRSLFNCGVHGKKPTIHSLSVETTLPGEWPWVVAVFRSRAKKLSFNCGGSLISNRLVITTAQCIDTSLFYDRARPYNTAVVVGARDVSRQTYYQDSTRFLKAMYTHEEFDMSEYLNNIALLVLKEPVTYSKFVKPVCLWEGEDDHDDLENIIQYGTEVGWGDINSVTTLEEPHRFKMSITPRATCRELNQEYREFIDEMTFCAATVTGKTIVDGFRGSGLFIEQHGRWMLRGINTFPIPDTENPTTVYIDVAKYRNWISDTAHRYMQTYSLPRIPIAYEAENNVSWTQQCSMHDEVDPLVAGGKSTREGEWPWHVAIFHHEHVGSSSLISYKCGGSIISPSHVLTAAHCIIDKLTNRPVAKSSINIYLGTHNIKSFSVGVQLKLVDRLDIHPEYNPQTQYKDIALLRLSSPAEFTAAVRPVCLWPEDKVDMDNVVGKNGSVVGWGKDEYGLLADELMLAELPVVSELTCLRSHIFYHKYTNNFTFCAGLLRDTSLCNGDSGGGMVFKLRSGAGKEVWFLRGIVSLRRATDKPCNPSQYVIFTDVAKYLDWIKNSISQDL